MNRRILDTLQGPLAQKILADEVARQVQAEVARQLSVTAEPTEEERQTEWVRSNRDFTSSLFFGSGLRYDRMLTSARFNELAKQIRSLTGVGQVYATMQLAYRLIIDHETRGLGRIAGSNYNVIGKLVAPLLLEAPAGPLLEIGTLFGVFSPALIRMFRGIGEFRTLTVVDPLEGTQIQPGTAGGGDPTGTPVTYDIAQRNMIELGLQPDEFRMIKGYSTDPAVQQQAADQEYSVIIIDGDHSEDGVHRDLWWTQEIAAPGAIIVMDDFGDPKWAGIDRALRRYLDEGGAFELIGSAATSAYLRMPS